jgi:NAD(P)H-dependent FMN reductase
MKRLALNGSPRGVKSNSRTIIGWMFEGMAAAGAGAPQILELARTGDLEAQREAFLDAEEVLLVFPLYTDSVPGIVKNFIDSLADASADRLAGKRFAFVVHSGFPESIHSEPVASYLERLCGRLGMIHCGTAIRGMSEGFRMMPPQMTRKPRELFSTLGASLVATGRFDEKAVRGLGRRRRLGPLAKVFLFLLRPTGLVNFYWNMMLKKNGAWERRFDRPYAPASG